MLFFVIYVPFVPYVAVVDKKTLNLYYGRTLSGLSEHQQGIFRRIETHDYCSLRSIP